jgi:sec-independent protein translocase protein TatC
MRRTAAATPSADTRRPVTLGVGEPFAVTIKVSAYAALLLSLPVILWQAYAFVLPAFSPRERQVALPLMLAVPFLFMAGVVFAYLVVLPRAIDFLQNFNDDQFDILLQARDYYRFSILLLIVMGLLFQIPVGILAATRMGIVSVEQLRRNRRYALLVIAVLAMLLPGTDPITMVVSMLPLVLLYEGSILFAALLDRRSARERERVEAEEAQRELDEMAVEDEDREPTLSHSDDKGHA